MRNLIFCLAMLQAACSSGPQNQIRNKAELLSLASNRANKTETKLAPIRELALKDTAISLAARAALAERAQEINSLVSKHEAFLTKVFNFRAMILDDNILPPVLIEARKTVSLSANDIIRVADANYQILYQARFVNNPPHWRDYLILNYEEPKLPDKSLLPKNSAEQKVWAKYINEGWQAGFLQAENIFKESLQRLQRDYNGMIRYHRLLAQNMLSKPYVASMEMGVTGDEANLNINDKILRITAFPSFNQDPKAWRTGLKEHE